MEYFHRLLANLGNSMRQFLRTHNIRIDLFWAIQIVIAVIVISSLIIIFSLNEFAKLKKSGDIDQFTNFTGKTASPSPKTGIQQEEEQGKDVASYGLDKPSEESGLSRKEYVPEDADVVSGELIIKFKDDVDLEENVFLGLLTKKVEGEEDTKYSKLVKRTVPDSLKEVNNTYGIDVVEKIGRESTQKSDIQLADSSLDNIFRIKVKDDKVLREVQEKLAANADIEYVEPNYLVWTQRIPNDPKYEELWGMKKILADRAWDLTIGSASVVIADIDTGVDYTHDDLRENIWVNTGETSKFSEINDVNGNSVVDCEDLFDSRNSFVSDGRDDDNNGYVDDFCGWDFRNDDNDPMDDHRHGTHTVGTLGGIGNNGEGVVGVNWNVKVLPIKFLGSEGSGALSGAVAAMKYAADMGADVSSNSWGAYYGFFSTSINAGVNYQHTAGVVVVVAAGNNSRDALGYTPACADRAITVSATDINDERASFSNWGEKIDVGAPGVDVLSAVLNDKYERYSGTSMATPHVSGLAALVLSIKPNLTNEQVRQIIRYGADDIGPIGKDIDFGYGRINAHKTIQFALENPDPLGPVITRPVSFYFTGAKEEFDIRGSIPGSKFKNYRLEFSEGAEWIRFKDSNKQVIDGVLGTIDVTQLSSDRLYDIRVVATDTSGREYEYRVNDIEFTNASSPDTENPTVEIISPMENQEMGGTQQVKIIATDNVGIRKVRLNIDSYDYTFMEPPFERDVDFDAFPAGSTQTVTAVAVDTSNNLAADSVQVRIKLSSTPSPTPSPSDPLSIISPRDGEVILLSKGSYYTPVYFSGNIDVKEWKIHAERVNTHYYSNCWSPSYPCEQDAPYEIMYMVYTPVSESLYYTLNIEAVGKDDKTYKSEDVRIKVVRQSSSTPTPAPSPVPPEGCGNGIDDAQIRVVSPSTGSSVSSPVKFEVEVDCRMGKIVIPYLMKDNVATYILDYVDDEGNISRYSKNVSLGSGNYLFKLGAKVTDQDGDRISDLQGNYDILKEIQSGPVIISVGEVQGASDYRQFYGNSNSGLFEKIVKLFFRIR